MNDGSGKADGERSCRSPLVNRLAWSAGPPHLEDADGVVTGARGNEAVRGPIARVDGPLVVAGEGGKVAPVRLAGTSIEGVAAPDLEGAVVAAGDHAIA